VLNLDPAKLLVIAVVAVILLGPDKLPQVARQVGAAWRSLGDFRHKMESEVRNSIPDLPSSAEIARLARSPSALLNHLSNMSSDGDSTSAGPTSADGPGDESPVTGGPAPRPTPTVNVNPNPNPPDPSLN
jgi:TatA/E family protein of Tat protein translocase